MSVCRGGATPLTRVCHALYTQVQTQAVEANELTLDGQCILASLPLHKGERVRWSLHVDPDRPSPMITGSGGKDGSPSGKASLDLSIVFGSKDGRMSHSIVQVRATAILHIHLTTSYRTTPAINEAGRR